MFKVIIQCVYKITQYKSEFIKGHFTTVQLTIVVRKTEENFKVWAIAFGFLLKKSTVKTFFYSSLKKRNWLNKYWNIRNF